MSFAQVIRLYSRLGSALGSELETAAERFVDMSADSVEVAPVVYVVGLMDHLYLKHEATRYKAGLEHLYSIELASRESIDLVSGVAACHNNVPRFARCFRGVKARYPEIT